MPWSRSDSDPIKARRRQLADQEKHLAERMAQLNRELHAGPGAPKAKKAPELPVWRMEEETPPSATSEHVPPMPRVLARQRRRDKVIFFLCIAFLLALMLAVACFWIHVHTAAN